MTVPASQSPRKAMAMPAKTEKITKYMTALAKRAYGVLTNPTQQPAPKSEGLFNCSHSKSLFTELVSGHSECRYALIHNMTILNNNRPLQTKGRLFFFVLGGLFL